MRRMKMLDFRWPLIAVIVLAALSCSDDISSPGEDPPIVLGNSGAYVVCEGIRGQDNATLSRLDDSSNALYNNFYRRVNPGLRLGDTANDILLRGDTAYVLVSSSETIECINTSTGRWIGRIHFPEGFTPRFMAATSPRHAYVSILNKDCLLAVDLLDLTLADEVCIPVGPAPEKLYHWDRFLAVANSGLGSLRSDEAKAGTVSIVDIEQRREIANFTAGVNTVAVMALPESNRLYAHYIHIPSSTWPQNDSLGGIIEFDITNYRELRHWRTPSISYDFVLSHDRSSLYFITLRGIESIDISETAVDKARLLIANDGGDRNMWYSLAVHPLDGQLWIANARRFTSAGQVILADPEGQILARHSVGINPTAFAFFKTPL